MDHDRPLLHVLLVDVREIEPLGEVKVELHGGALPLPADGVEDLDVNLWPVERAAALVNLVIPTLLRQRVFQRALRLVPDLRPAHRLLRLRGEVHLELLEAEGAQDVLRQIEHPFDLVGDLIGEAEDVRIVLGKPADAEQAVHGAAPFVPVHCAHLGPPDREVAVGEVAILVDGDVEGAVHGFELVGLVLHVDGPVHVLGVEIGVAGCLPKVELAHVRGVEQVVAALEVYILPEPLDHVPHERPLGVPEHQPSAHVLLLDGEQVEILAHFPVVAPGRLGLEVVVRLELLGRAPSRAVDALEHRALLVAPPVRARHGLEVDRLGVNCLGGLHVRTRAEIPPLVTDMVDGDGLRLDGVEDLELVRLVEGLDPLARLLAADLLAAQGHVLVDDLDHLLLDVLEVFVCHRREGDVNGGRRRRGQRICQTRRFGERVLVTTRSGEAARGG